MYHWFSHARFLALNAPHLKIRPQSPKQRSIPFLGPFEIGLNWHLLRAVSTAACTGEFHFAAHSSYFSTSVFPWRRLKKLHTQQYAVILSVGCKDAVLC